MDAETPTWFRRPAGSSALLGINVIDESSFSMLGTELRTRRGFGLGNSVRHAIADEIAIFYNGSGHRS
jgi:hypothetical protein